MNFANMPAEDIESSVLDVTEGAASWLTYLEEGKQAGRGIIYVCPLWQLGYGRAILARHIPVFRHR